MIAVALLALVAVGLQHSVTATRDQREWRLTFIAASLTSKFLRTSIVTLITQHSHRYTHAAHASPSSVSLYLAGLLHFSTLHPT